MAAFSKFATLGIKAYVPCFRSRKAEWPKNEGRNEKGFLANKSLWTSWLGPLGSPALDSKISGLIACTSGGISLTTLHLSVLAIITPGNLRGSRHRGGRVQHGPLDCHCLDLRIDVI